MRCPYDGLAHLQSSPTWTTLLITKIERTDRSLEFLPCITNNSFLTTSTACNNWLTKNTYAWTLSNMQVLFKLTDWLVWRCTVTYAEASGAPLNLLVKYVEEHKIASARETLLEWRHRRRLLRHHHHHHRHLLHHNSCHRLPIASFHFHHLNEKKITIYSVSMLLYCAWKRRNFKWILKHNNNTIICEREVHQLVGPDQTQCQQNSPRSHRRRPEVAMTSNIRCGCRPDRYGCPSEIWWF